MTKTPIHVIVAGLRRMSLPQQIEYLRDLAKQERIHSVRRNELESLLRGKVSKQLAAEDREDRRVHRTNAPAPASAPIGQETAECAA